jgi:hypothetical protein
MIRIILSKMTGNTHINVILKLVRATVVLEEKQQVLLILSGFSSLCYPGRKAHALYFHLWPTPFYTLFSRYLINGNIFGKCY